LARYGHVALHLPPYHPELNPIEKMWAVVKNWVAMKNVTFQLQEI
jgi:transposase